MPLFIVMVGVIKELESRRNKFFQGGNKVERKMVWVKWDIVTSTFDKGDLEGGKLGEF